MNDIPLDVRIRAAQETLRAIEVACVAGIPAELTAVAARTVIKAYQTGEMQTLPLGERKA